MMTTDQQTSQQELHKQHFACFACRKAFKQRGSEEIGVAAERPFPCPECAAPMLLVGRDFRAPPQRAVKQWQVLELLRNFGVIFEPGLNQPARQPENLQEAESFLVKQGYDEQVIRQRLENLRNARQTTKPLTRMQKKQREGRGPRK